MWCAWRSGRRFLVVHGIGGLMDFRVEELDDRIEKETQDHVEFGDDDERESEIEALVGALERKEESDAIEVLATWKGNQDGHGPRKARSGTEGARTPTLEQYADRQERSGTRSRKVGRSHFGVIILKMAIFSRNCPKTRVQAPGVTPACELCHAIKSCQQLPTSSQPMNHIWRN